MYMYKYIKYIIRRYKNSVRFRYDKNYNYDNKYIEMYIINDGYE